MLAFRFCTRVWLSNMGPPQNGQALWRLEELKPSVPFRNSILTLYRLYPGSDFDETLGEFSASPGELEARAQRASGDDARHGRPLGSGLGSACAIVCRRPAQA